VRTPPDALRSPEVLTVLMCPECAPNCSQPGVCQATLASPIGSLGRWSRCGVLSAAQRG